MVGKRNNILANAISTKTGNAGSRPGSTSPPVRLAAQPLALPRLPPLPHAQPVVSFVQLFVVQLSVTISVFALERVTPAEIKGAGWTVREARQLGVAIDNRRRNASVEGLQANVQRLKEYRSKLIVFPRKSGKGGSSAEEVATATQTAQLPVRQDYAFGEFDAPRAITEEEKKHCVFQAIRMARANKKLAGGRAKRAREAEEAAKQAAPKKK